MSIWRFLDLKKFCDLIGTGELHFCRADLFQDASEGLPPENFTSFLRLNRFDLRDREELNTSWILWRNFARAFI
jgi:hypothetical protein